MRTFASSAGSHAQYAGQTPLAVYWPRAAFMPRPLFRGDDMHTSVRPPVLTTKERLALRYGQHSEPVYVARQGLCVAAHAQKAERRQFQAVNEQ